MRVQDVLIVGGGPAGRSIVHTLHAAGSELTVTLVKDEQVNVNRCAVPYGIPSSRPLERFQIPNRLVTDYGAELIVARIDRLRPDAHEVTLSDGSKLGYRRLVLATGARPLIPPIPGCEAENVTAVRSLADLGRLREFASAGRRAVVVGAGYIGVEIAVALREYGLDVSIVERLPSVMGATAEPEITEPLTTTLLERGVLLHLGVEVVELPAVDGRVSGVTLSTGETLAADFVVMAVGVLPNMDLARDAGIETTRLGIRTDDHLRTSAPDVSAAGDCVEARSFVTGEPVPGDFGTNAVFMAKVVAENLLGVETTFPGVLNAAASTVFEWSFGSAGLTMKAAREAGIDAVSGTSRVLDRYPMMDGVGEILTKLVFERSGLRLIGGSILRRGRGAAQGADFLSLAIKMGAAAQDLLTYQYATHPELAAKPSDNTYLFAARDALDSSQARIQVNGS
jgi:NADPH-dependent 2,4-dienoyl-CoA reductase/sulfur reductase-like enzyme